MAFGRKREEFSTEIEPSEDSRIMRFIYAILHHRRLVIILFALFTVLCAFCIPFVNVNYSLSSYLPQESKSTIAMDLMDEVYEAEIPNARMYVTGISLNEASNLANDLAGIEGVDEPLWLGSQVDIKQPLEVQNSDTIESWMNDEGYLFQLTIGENTASALEQARELAYQNGAVDVAMSGDAPTNVNAQESTATEVFYIMLMAIVIIIIIISLTSESWFEWVIFLLVLAMAIIMNMGTNIFKGEISFITQICAAVLQLAVSMDYAIVMLHTFRRYQAQYPGDPIKAMAHAMYKGFSVVLSSAAVTFFGFLSLSVMSFLIGADMGIVLAKGIFFSFLAVMFLMPCVILACQKPLKHFEHKPLMPSFDKFGTWCTRLMIPISIIVCIIAVPSFFGQSKTDFTYGAAGMIEEGTQLGDETKAVDDAFESEETWVMMVPADRWADEKALVNEIKALPQVKNVISYTSSVGEQVPTEMVPTSQLSQLISGGYSRVVIQTTLDSATGTDYEMVETVRNIGESYFGAESHLVGSQVTEYDLKATTGEDSGRVKVFSVGAIALVLMLMFRSLSIPFVVLLPIQVSIWINLAIPYFTGSSINYIGYLVVDAVQLGASVDYAIIYTREYLEQRRKYPAFTAARIAISKSAITIMTSALILTIAGMSIFFIASNTLISEIGLLIGRGAFISMFMMFTLLPLLFVLFDWIIRHTSIGLRFHVEKSKKNLESGSAGTQAGFRNMALRRFWNREAPMSEKKNLRRKKYSFGKTMIAVGCSVVLMAGMLPQVLTDAYASPREAEPTEPTVASGSLEESSEKNTISNVEAAHKEEVVYVKLSQAGAVEGAYVVNSFNVQEQIKLKDPGVYTSVTNLSTNDEIKNENGVTEVTVPEGEFFYEGVLQKDTKFPWDIKIDYMLDGKAVDPEELRGATGSLAVGLHIVPQAEGESIFADNYLVQVTGSFSSDSAKDLAADGGSIASAGSSQQVSFMILPGGEEAYEITAYVEDFSFDGFTIAAVPLSMALDLDEYDTGELGSSVDELKEAVAKIDDGAGSLKSASDKVAEGIALLAANNQTLVESSSSVQGGIGQLNDAASQLASGSSAYVSIAEDQATEAYGKAAEASALAAGKQSDYSAAMVDAQANLQSASVDLTAAYTALAQGDTAGVQAALDEISSDLGGMQGSLSDVSEAIGSDANPGLVNYQAQASAYMASGDTSTALTSAYDDINSGIQSLATSVLQMKIQYSLFDEGIQTYVGGVSALNTNYGSYTQGLQTYKQGTEEFKNQTIDLDQKILDSIKDQLNDYLDPQYELHSFVDPANTEVTRVQFIYMTDPIEEPSEEPVEVEEVEEETFWTRLLGLFG